MKLSRMLLVAMAALALTPIAHAADTTPNQLSTEQKKIYLLGDGTWVDKTIVVDPSGAVSTGTPGAAAPGSASQVGGTDGTNLRALSTDAAGKLNINAISGAITLPTGAATSAKQPALGTAGTPSADVLTVQGSAGGTAINVTGTGTAGTPATGVQTIQGISGGTPLPIAGTTANTVASAANPVPTALYTSAGVVTVYGATSTDGLATAATINTPYGNSIPRLLNGAGTLDRQRGNVEITAATALAAQAAATVNGTDQVNYNGRGVVLFVNISAITTATLTVNIQIKDAVSGVYVTVLSSTALATTGMTVLTVYPGLTAAANSVANTVLPRTWRVQSVVTGTSVTATFGATNLL